MVRKSVNGKCIKQMLLRIRCIDYREFGLSNKRMPYFFTSTTGAGVRDPSGPVQSDFVPSS